MGKKLLIGLVTAAIVVGGFLVVRAVWDYETHQAYLRSSDYVADQLLHDLISGNANAAYTGLFSAGLRSDYSQGYWADKFFPPFKNYRGTPRLVNKKAANGANASQPAPYPADVDAQQYMYDFRLSGVTMRVTMVVYRQSGAWKVNELRGVYQP